MHEPKAVAQFVRQICDRVIAPLGWRRDIGMPAFWRCIGVNQNLTPPKTLCANLHKKPRAHTPVSHCATHNGPLRFVSGTHNTDAQCWAMPHVRGMLRRSTHARRQICLEAVHPEVQWSRPAEDAYLKAHE